MSLSANVWLMIKQLTFLTAPTHALYKCPMTTAIHCICVLCLGGTCSCICVPHKLWIHQLQMLLSGQLGECLLLWIPLLAPKGKAKCQLHYLIACTASTEVSHVLWSTLKRSGYKIWSYPISTAHHSLWALQTGYAYPLHSIQYLKSCDPHTGPMITRAALFLINAASNVMQSLRSSSSWRTLVQHQEIIPDRVSVGGRCDRYNKLVRFVHFTQPMALQSLSVCMFRVCTCVCVGGNRELGLRGNNSTYKVYSQLGMS